MWGERMGQPLSDSEQMLVSSLNLILLFISIAFVFKATFY